MNDQKVFSSDINIHHFSSSRLSVKLLAKGELHIQVQKKTNQNSVCCECDDIIAVGWIFNVQHYINVNSFQNLNLSFLIVNGIFQVQYKLSLIVRFCGMLINSKNNFHFFF